MNRLIEAFHAYRQRRSGGCIDIGRALTRNGAAGGRHVIHTRRTGASPWACAQWRQRHLQRRQRSWVGNSDLSLPVLSGRQRLWKRPAASNGTTTPPCETERRKRPFQASHTALSASGTSKRRQVVDNVVQAMRYRLSSPENRRYYPASTVLLSRPKVFWRWSTAVEAARAGELARDAGSRWWPVKSVIWPSGQRTRRHEIRV